MKLDASLRWHDNMGCATITNMAHRILLADPNKTVRLAAQMVFAKSADIILMTALNSFEALDKMHRLQPTLTLMDSQLAHQLRRNLKKPPCPVVILEKPFTSLSLVDQVRQALLRLLPQSQQQSSTPEAREKNI
ncbi:MAG: hypothetical protein JKY15_00485 [Deltaproteobacteria bacterium]|nr:hypothetical protein [Deltaproteobacteria bacterium]